MKKKRGNVGGNKKQLDLFEDFLPSYHASTIEDKIICFSSKRKEINIQKEKVRREKSIKNLLNYAENLDW